MFSKGSDEKSFKRTAYYLQSKINVLVALQVFKSEKKVFGLYEINATERENFKTS